LPERGNTKKNGTVIAEPAVEIGKAGNYGKGLNPANGGGTVKARVVILARTAATNSEEKRQGGAEEKESARVLPGGEEAAQYKGAV